MQFQRPNIVKNRKRILMWKHAWRKQGSLIGLVIGKRPLGKPRLRWEDCEGHKNDRTRNQLKKSCRG